MKSKTNIILLILTFPVLFLSSCENSFLGCVQGNGRIAAEDRNIGDFENIISHGDFVIDVSVGKSPAMTIETDENLLSYIRTSIQGNSLVIETKSGRCIRSSEPIHIYVDAEHIEKLKLSGSGLINCDNISGEDLELDVSGSGNISCLNIDLNYIKANVSGSGIIELTGTSGTCDYIISGSGSIKAINLITDRCFADISGSGVIYTTVNKTLDVDISGSGVLYYKGDPEISKSISGSGDVRIYR